MIFKVKEDENKVIEEVKEETTENSENQAKEN